MGISVCCTEKTNVCIEQGAVTHEQRCYLLRTTKTFVCVDETSIDASKQLFIKTIDYLYQTNNNFEAIH